VQLQSEHWAVRSANNLSVNLESGGCAADEGAPPSRINEKGAPNRRESVAS